MRQRQCHWKIQHQLDPVSDGWHRWDKAYQLVIASSSAKNRQLIVTKIEISQFQGQSEVKNEGSNLCEGIHSTSSSNSDH